MSRIKDSGRSVSLQERKKNILISSTVQHAFSDHRINYNRGERKIDNRPLQYQNFLWNNTSEIVSTLKPNQNNITKSKSWEDLLELSSDAVEYVVIEERLTEPLRKKWKDAKRTNLEYYMQTSILNVRFYIRQEGLLIVIRIQPYLITNMSIKLL